MTGIAKPPLLGKREIESILSQRFAKDRFCRLKDLPPPEKLHGIPQACDLIIEAMQQKRRIVVIGDYDVDGIVSTAIMVDFFHRLSYPITSVIPNRFCDGYGLSPALIERLETDLIITVDNGIMAHEAAKICQERGISLIITDHHTPPLELPCAKVIINPKLSCCSFPQKEICGASVAWYLCAALKGRLEAKIDMGEFLDLLALAIIADVMPLVEVNRLLVRQGLKEMARSNRAAFVVLKEKLRKSHFSGEDVAFLIAPLLNSAGRMEDASLSLEFLLSDSILEAGEKFDRLCALNCLRKETESRLFEEALGQIDLCGEALLAYGEDWHEGVLGIVASRLTDRYKKPAFILTQKEGSLKGSARSVGELDLVRLLQKSHHLLLRYGGHKGAAGIQLRRENFESFKQAIEEELSRIKERIEWRCEGEECLGEIALESVDAELLDILERFEPYGEGNPKPRFFCKELKVCRYKIVGAEKNHTSLVLKNLSGGDERKAIAFRQVYEFAPLASVSCLFSLSRDMFSTESIPQLIIERLEIL